MTPIKTPYGTPCSPRWTNTWIRRVIQLEYDLDHPICGARNLLGNPCTRSSCHASGRCPLHGGVHGIGAQRGNSNAKTHGLYARKSLRDLFPDFITRNLTCKLSAKSDQNAYKQRQNAHKQTPNAHKTRQNLLQKWLESQSALHRAATAALAAATKPDQQKGNPHAILDAYIRISQRFRSVATKLEETFEPREQTREPTLGLQF